MNKDLIILLALMNMVADCANYDETLLPLEDKLPILDKILEDASNDEKYSDENIVKNAVDIILDIVDKLDS